MVWSIVTVVVLGVVLGACFRAPALLAATAVTVAVAALLLDGPLVSRVMVPVIGLQCAYLAGLGFASLWQRIAAKGRWRG